jgi:hemerythrin-like metal-binding protein
MSLINWTPRLSVGTTTLDADHIILIGIINQLYDAMKEGHGEELFDTIMSTMTQYTVTHFRREESMMQESNYPKLEDHKKHHEGLIKRLNDFMDKYARDKTSLTTEEISEFLQGWLVNHIQKVDFGYKPYMHDSGDTC